MDKIFNIENIVKLLGIDADTIIGLLTMGELKGFQIGNKWRVRETDLISFLDHKVELERMKVFERKLNDSNTWIEIIKSENPSFLRQIETTIFPEGSFGAFLKKGLENKK